MGQEVSDNVADNILLFFYLSSFPSTDYIELKQVQEKEKIRKVLKLYLLYINKQTNIVVYQKDLLVVPKITYIISWSLQVHTGAGSENKGHRVGIRSHPKICSYRHYSQMNLFRIQIIDGTLSSKPLSFSLFLSTPISLLLPSTLQFSSLYVPTLVPTYIPPQKESSSPYHSPHIYRCKQKSHPFSTTTTTKQS